jgi:uncharacterized glyoxalase superfamily protein PhnB
MSIKFSGINIHSKDPVKSFEFYKGLGLTVSEEVTDPNNEWYGASFDIGGSALWIWRDNSGNDTDSNGRMTVEIVMGLEDIDKSYTEFMEKGYAVSEVEKMFYGGREMKLTDPDGNKILFLD